MTSASATTRFLDRFRGLPLLAAALLAVAPSGCSTLWRRGPVDQNVMACRQHVQRATAAMYDRRYDEAAALLSRAIDSAPTNVEARKLYAEALWQLDRRREAIAQLENAVRFSGEDPVVLTKLGQMYLAEGDLPRALKRADAALWKDVQLASAWALRGDVLARQDKLDEAAASYLRALSYRPDFRRAQIAVAEVYRRQNRPRRALVMLQRLKSDYAAEDVPPRVVWLEGLALKALDRPEAAAERLRWASGRMQPTAEMWLALADTEIELGNISAAREAADHARAGDPKSTRLKVLLARLDGLRRGAVERRLR